MNVFTQPKAGYTDVLTAEAGHPEGVISAHAGRHLRVLLQVKTGRPEGAFSVDSRAPGGVISSKSWLLSRSLC